MRFFARLLRSTRIQVRGGVTEQRYASDSVPDASALIRAAEIALEAGETREALALYGRALDAYLRSGDRRKAERTCRLMIRIEPRVIRTRYTLAAIAVGRNDERRARARISDYMTAVAAAGAQDIAVPSLMELAGATANPAMRQLIAGALRRAARADLAEAIRAGTAAPPVADSWSRAVSAATTRRGTVAVVAPPPAAAPTPAL